MKQTLMHVLAERYKRRLDKKGVCHVDANIAFEEGFKAARALAVSACERAATEDNGRSILWGIAKVFKKLGETT